MTTGDGPHPHQGVMLARLESTLPHTKKMCTPLLPPFSAGTIRHKPGGVNALIGENLFKISAPWLSGPG